MSARGVSVDILLGLATVIVLASSVGVLVMRDTYQKLHYVTPATIVAPFIVGLAVLVQSGLTENSAETWLALVFVLVGGPYLSHATIRAVRIREKGDWRPGAAGEPRAGEARTGDARAGEPSAGDARAGEPRAGGSGAGDG